MKRLKYKKKICIVSTSRADLGQLSGVVKIFQKSTSFNTQLIISGLHLNKFSKFSHRETNELNLKISKKIFVDIKKFSEKDINQYFSEYLKKFSKYFDINKPDLLILLGDRYETFAVATSAFFFNIPIAHIHGGEITVGSKDDSIRHAISKLSNYHFVANDIFKKRLIRMGETPNSIFVTGSPGLSNLKKMKFLSKLQIEKKLKISLKKRNFIVTLHPEIDKKKTDILSTDLFEILKKLNNSNIFICSPNADIFSDIIRKKIESFIKKNKNTFFFENLGFKNYLSLAKLCNFVIGNSSSGITEMPFLGIPSINIGLRQKGRPFAKSVFSTNYSKKKIKDTIFQLLNVKKNYLKQKLYYYDNNSNINIFKIIKNIDLKKKKYKEFFDKNDKYR